MKRALVVAAFLALVLARSGKSSEVCSNCARNVSVEGANTILAADDFSGAEATYDNYVCREGYNCSACDERTRQDCTVVKEKVHKKDCCGILVVKCNMVYYRDPEWKY